MAGEHVQTFTDDNFDAEVLQSDLPVLVDFWATWCAPCRAVAPVVAQIAEERAGQLKVGKLDVDDNQAVAQKFGIRGIPTLLLFKEGQVAGQLVGAVPKTKLEEFVEQGL